MFHFIAAAAATVIDSSRKGRKQPVNFKLA